MTEIEPSDEELAQLEQSGFQISEAFIGADADLEALWADAKAHIPPPKTHKTALKRLVEAEEASRAIYTNPENWIRTRGIALIHKDTMTCLGNFAEYIHLRVINCRKLIREEAPLACEGVEYVEGSWWLHTERKPEVPQIWHTQTQAMVHVKLDELRVHAPACALRVFLSYGSVARVELMRQTQFAQWETDRPVAETLLWLPEGTNILDVLSKETKIALRKELDL